MNNTKKIVGILVIFMFLQASFVFSQNWMEWRGANREGKVAGFTVPDKWPETLTQKWQVTVGAGDATPALVGDKLYVFTRQGSDEVTMCLDANNGKVLWQDKYAAQAVTGAAARHPGPRSSPTIVNGKVVTLGVASILSCLDAATGKVVWRNEEFSGKVPVYFTGMSPIFYDGNIIAHLGEQDNGAIIALDLNSGQEKWRWSGDGPAYGSPVLLTMDDINMIVFQTEMHLVSIAAKDGKFLWQVETPPQRRFYNSATPVIGDNTVIFTGQGLGTKSLKVQKQNSTYVTAELWHNLEYGTGYNTPVLKGGNLYGLSDKGFLYCMNASTGEIAWADTVKYQNFGAILDAGEVMMALPSNSELIVFQPSDTGYMEVARYKVAETPTYAHPVIAGNKIFVKDQDKLTLWIIE